MIKITEPIPKDLLRRGDLAVGDLVVIRSEYVMMYPVSFVSKRIYVVTSLEGFGINGVYIYDTVIQKTMPINASLLKKVDKE